MRAESSDYGLTLNTKKTKFMLVSKAVHDRVDIFVNSSKIEQVQKYKYIGTTVNETNEYSEEIRTR